MESSRKIYKVLVNRHNELLHGIWMEIKRRMSDARRRFETRKNKNKTKINKQKHADRHTIRGRFAKHFRVSGAALIWFLLWFRFYFIDKKFRSHVEYWSSIFDVNLIFCERILNGNQFSIIRTSARIRTLPFASWLKALDSSIGCFCCSCMDALISALGRWSLIKCMAFMQLAILNEKWHTGASPQKLLSLRVH